MRYIRYTNLNNNDAVTTTNKAFKGYTRVSSVNNLLG